jgi:hypothetical protein
VARSECGVYTGLLARRQLLLAQSIRDIGQVAFQFYDLMTQRPDVCGNCR